MAQLSALEVLRPLLAFLAFHQAGSLEVGPLGLQVEEDPQEDHVSPSFSILVISNS